VRACSQPVSPFRKHGGLVSVSMLGLVRHPRSTGYGCCPQPAPGRGLGSLEKRERERLRLAAFLGIFRNIYWNFWNIYWNDVFCIFHAVAQRDPANKRVGNTARMTAAVTVLPLLQKNLTFFSQLSFIDLVPGAVCLPCVAKSNILDHNPGRARVLDAIFLAFSNDVFSSPRRVISHILPICLVSVVGRDDVAPSQFHAQLENCTLARHGFRILECFLQRGGDIQSSAKRLARVASRLFDIEAILLDDAGAWLVKQCPSWSPAARLDGKGNVMR
jgi:hypothetical protein